MKTKNFLVIGTLSLALSSVVFTSCTKDNNTKSTNVNTTPDYAAAEDEANASFVVNDTKNISDGAAKGQAVDRTLNGYPILYRRDTIISSVKDSLFDIYFGPTDVACSDGVNRRGHVLVWFDSVPASDHFYWALNSIITMGFKNYYCNDIGVAGTRSLTNTGTNAWSFNAALTLTYPNNGGQATWYSTRQDSVKTVNGIAYWVVYGTAYGTSRTGATYQINITSPIYYEIPWWLGYNSFPDYCLCLESGKLTCTVSNYPYPLYVTFGTAIGTCSNQETATINNTTYTFYQIW